MITPASGDEWEQGTTYDITWTSENIDYVKIELYKGTSLDTTLVDSIAALPGSWPWTIPLDQEIGTDYQIKISDVTNAEIFDESDEFSIVGGKKRRITK